MKETERFEVRRIEDAPRGDLYELEQKTRFHVIEKSTGAILYSFEGFMEASLSRDTGLWEDFRFSGVSDVSISENERSVIVMYHDNRIEDFPLRVEEQ